MGPETKRLTTNLLTTARMFAKHYRLAMTSLGIYATNDSQIFERVERGLLRTATYDRAMAYFDSYWPDDVPWPDGVPRPSLEQPKTEGALQDAQ